MQCFDDVTTFSPLQVLPSNDLQKDPYINRYVQYENFYLAIYFYPKYVMQGYADTPSLVLFWYIWENVIDVKKKRKKKKRNVECFKVMNAQ